MTRSTDVGSRTEQSHGDHQALFTMQGKERIWAALMLTCAFTGKSWRLGVTRSERLPLAPVDSGRALKIMCKQRPDELKHGKVEAL